MHAIETNNLTKKFGDTIAVNGLDLTVDQGKIFGLIGPDGAGKTTTIRLLCCLLTPMTGSAKVLGLDILKDHDKIKDSIGYMSQKFSLYQDLTVEENLDFFAQLRGVERDRIEKQKKRLYEFSRLEKFKDRPAGKLSGGMKQKLALSATLMHSPQLLFLDEPTTGVDPVSRVEFWEIIKSLAPRVTIFVTTPYMDEAEKCDSIGFINNGAIMAQDTPANIKALGGPNAGMEDAFILLMEKR